MDRLRPDPKQDQNKSKFVESLVRENQRRGIFLSDHLSPTTHSHIPVYMFRSYIWDSVFLDKWGNLTKWHAVWCNGLKCRALSVVWTRVDKGYKPRLVSKTFIQTRDGGRSSRVIQAGSKGLGTLHARGAMNGARVRQCLKRPIGLIGSQ